MQIERGIVLSVIIRTNKLTVVGNRHESHVQCEYCKVHLCEPSLLGNINIFSFYEDNFFYGCYGPFYSPDFI